MEETTEIVILTSLVQTVVISLTLLIFIFQFRSQVQATKVAAYQNLMGRYNDFMMLQAEKPELTRMLRDQLSTRNPKRKVTPEDASVIVNLLIAYGIIEEAFLLYARKWISKDGWEQWATWLKDLTKHPKFIHIHKRTRGQWDKRFEEYVSKLLDEKTL